MTPTDTRIEIAETGSDISRRVATLVRDSSRDCGEIGTDGSPDGQVAEASPMVRVIAGTFAQIDKALSRLDESGAERLDCALVAVSATDQVEEIWAAHGRRLADVLPVDTAPLEFRRRLERAANLCRLQRELMHYRQFVAMEFGMDAVIGSSRTMCAIRDKLASLSPTDIAITFTGPPGSGKTFLARVAHLHSERRYQPLISIDFAALEAERQIDRLFRAGSGTAALEQAHLGTLLLDNVDAMATATQERLLEFLKDRKLEAAGDTRKLDVRLLSTSCRDLSRCASRGQFSNDLRCRLSEITVDLPALENRWEDIEALTAHTINRLNLEHQPRQFGLTAEAVNKLRKHSWPNNVRELVNVLWRAATLTDADTISPSEIRFSGEDVTAPTPPTSILSSAKMSGGLMDTTQRTLILEALNENDWNYTRTAERLGIGRTTLWRKIKKYNLKDEAPQVEEGAS